MKSAPLPFPQRAAAELARDVLSRGRALPGEVPRLLDPSIDPHLEELAGLAHRLTLARFGRTVQLYAPVYLSNACRNRCLYCGFSARNEGTRVTLDGPAIDAELQAVRAQGFGHVLLVTGEAPDLVDLAYLEDAVRRAKRLFPSVSVEIYPLEEAGYRRLVEAGADGLVLYQETYDRDLYARVHAGGPKADFDWRFEAPERACRAGMRKVGLGALLGLGEPAEDARALVAHALDLRRRHWRTFFTLSVPRMRQAQGGMRPRVDVDDRLLARLIVTLRLVVEDAGIVVSTREQAALRDRLVPLGVTQMSAGSRTEPGGYTHRGQESCQFEVADERAPSQVARDLAARGYEAVWKDWERGLG